MFLKFFTIVPEKHIYIIERFGKFRKQLSPGFHFMVPIADRIAYQHNLKQTSIDIQRQTAITKDNVSLQIDGMIFLQINDAFDASYKIQRPYDSIRMLALTVMRSQIGKLKLDQLLQEREKINQEIHNAVQLESKRWGVNCKRYEILNIDVPQQIKKAMEFEVQAQRQKRSQILISQAKQIGKIKEEQGKKQSIIHKAEGISDGIKIIAQKEKQANQLLNLALDNKSIKDYILIKKYLDNYKEILQNSNVIVNKDDGSNQKGNDSILALALLMKNLNTESDANMKSSENKMGSDYKVSDQILKV